MTELELFDKLNPKRDLPQATCDIISQVYKVMDIENEQLKSQIEKMKCCGNCEFICFDYPGLFCTVKDEYIDANAVCEKWDMRK